MNIIYIYFKKAISKFTKSFLLTILWAMILTFIYTLSPIFIRQLLREVEIQSSYTVLIYGTLIYIFLLLVNNIIDIFWYRSIDKFAGLFIKDEMKLLERKVYLLYGNQLDEFSRPRISHILYQNLFDMFRVIGHNLASMLTSSLLVLVSMILVYSFDRKLFLILLLGLLAGLTISFYSRRVIQKSSMEINNKMRKLHSLANDFSSRPEHIWRRKLISYYAEKTDDTVDEFINTAKVTDSKQVFFSNLVSHVNAVFILAVSAYFAIEYKGNLASLVYIITLANIISQHSSKAEILLNQIMRSYSAFKNIYELEQIEDKEQYQNKHDVSEPASSVNTIELRNLTFTYHGLEHNILDGLNFRCKSGDCIKVHAANGKGKSTLFKLLENIYSLDRGMYFINGIDSKDLSPKYFQKEFRYIGQDNSFINDKVWVYLCATLGIKDKDTLEIELKKRNLDKLIDLDLEMKELCSSLSFGQRKKLDLILLALSYHNSSVFLFDEVEAGLDKNGQEIFLNIVKEMRDRNKIIFFINHEESLLDNNLTIEF